MNTVHAVIQILHSIPQQVVWGISAIIFCILGLRLLLLLAGKKRGSGLQPPKPEAGQRAIEALAKELLEAQRSSYYRERVFRRLRDLAVDIISLRENVRADAARMMLREGSWTDDTRLRGLAEWILEPQPTARAGRLERAEFLGNIHGFLAGLQNTRGPSRTEKGKAHGN